VDPLEAIYPDKNEISNYSNNWKADFAKGGIADAHVLLKLPINTSFRLTAFIDGEKLSSNYWSALIDVPVEQNTGLDSRTEQYLNKKNPFVIRRAPFRIFEVIKPIEGVHIGTVKKIDADPLNEGRIQVLIPALKSTGNGIWAKLSHFYVSAAAGSFFIPEIDSQVVVSFISNDPRHPIILGSLYTSTKQPYTELTADNALKAFVSKSKLTLEFDDKEKIITISSPKENSIVISEKAKGIVITDENKNIFKLSDTGIELTSKNNIKITSSGSVTIAGSKGVILEGKTQDGIKLTGSKVNIVAETSLVAEGKSKVDVVASGKVTIKGASVGIN
jgi:uncharacterized protein involved in type VI secretion and phage assembly